MSSSQSAKTTHLIRNALESLQDALQSDTDLALSDFELLTEMNHAAAERYRGMANAAEGLRTDSEFLQEQYKDIKKYVEQVDEVSKQVKELEGVAKELDEWSGELEIKCRRLFKFGMLIGLFIQDLTDHVSMTPPMILRGGLHGEIRIYGARLYRRLSPAGNTTRRTKNHYLKVSFTQLLRLPIVRGRHGHVCVCYLCIPPLSLRLRGHNMAHTTAIDLRVREQAKTDIGWVAMGLWDLGGDNRVA
ncbi:hypothetical protein G7K_2150-t1 [Saitoella complicata NRRL Y-17804]|uniref:Uncharacterized protein n=2 Tax=Saitoella complicata (strain BCRC 22490 / CBS 7301 / JCM 7358 / NBRC 10748 / NRRL Y-17804) TaxID=698492 RepID=A0A0E9NE32_SAICN|nr:hypothetical protein G7K_2150-t1 [Saitoella complicata NRRL Y-17804]